VLDAPVKLDETEAEITKIDKAALKKVFEELNFKSLLNRLAKESHKVIKVQSKSKEKKEAEEQLGLL